MAAILFRPQRVNIRYIHVNMKLFLTHNQLEMHGCIFSNVASDVLGLQHHDINTHGD